MLKQLRKRKTAKRILWTLAIIIIPPFIFWGTGGLLREKGKNINYAGKIFGRKVGFSEYENSLLAVKTQLFLQYGENFEKIEQYLGLSQRAWERLILLSEAKRRRIKIQDNEVVKTVESMPFFQKNGIFDKKIYDYILRYIFKLPTRLFEENLRDSLAISKLYESITTAVNISDENVRTEYEKENKQIDEEKFAKERADFKDKLLTREKEKAFIGFLEKLKKKANLTSHITEDSKI